MKPMRLKTPFKDEDAMFDWANRVIGDNGDFIMLALVIMGWKIVPQDHLDQGLRWPVVNLPRDLCRPGWKTSACRSRRS
jgi:hypothetical protein